MAKAYPDIKNFYYFNFILLKLFMRLSVFHVYRSFVCLLWWISGHCLCPFFYWKYIFLPIDLYIIFICEGY